MGLDSDILNVKLARYLIENRQVSPRELLKIVLSSYTEKLVGFLIDRAIEAGEDLSDILTKAIFRLSYNASKDLLEAGIRVEEKVRVDVAHNRRLVKLLIKYNQINENFLLIDSVRDNDFKMVKAAVRLGATKTDKALKMALKMDQSDDIIDYLSSL